MDISADIFRKLSALKLEPEAMSAVLEIISEIQEVKTRENEETARRRGLGAARQRKYRERYVTRHSDVTVTLRNASLPLLLPPDDNNSTPPLTPKNKKLGARDGRAVPLPEGWQPDDADREYGKTKGLSNSQFESLLEAMRLWAKSKGEKKVDWHATLKGFLRREAEKNGAANGLDRVIGVKAQWRIGADGKWTKELP